MVPYRNMRAVVGDLPGAFSRKSFKARVKNEYDEAIIMERRTPRVEAEVSNVRIIDLGFRGGLK